VQSKTATIVLSGLALGASLASAQRSRTARETTPDALQRMLDRGEKVLVIDVRTDEEISFGSIPGAIHIPMDQLEARMKDVPKDMPLVFICNGGELSSWAAELFVKKGFTTATFCPLDGWKAKGKNTSPPAKPPEGPIPPR
jgi:rhodanese-related sulfurtransferase